MEEEGRKVGDVGERVAVAVAKKGVVGEFVVVLVGEVGIVEVEVLLLLLLPPEEIIWLDEAQMKTGRPIVSFARVSISFFFRFNFVAKVFFWRFAFVLLMESLVEAEDL